MPQRPALLVALIVVWGARAFLAEQCARASPGPATLLTAGQSTKPGEQPKDSIVYVNDRYRFKFSLPKSWKGYSVLTSQWEGAVLGSEDAAGKARTEVGPKITIRNPRWTEAKPWQDIPIMVFTIDQWKLIEQEKLAVSAAPIGPSEMGRNSRYVFGLPARYNFGDALGIDEVSGIINSGPLHAY